MIDIIFTLAESKGWDAQKTFDPKQPESAEAGYVVYCQIHRWLHKYHIYISVTACNRESTNFSYFVSNPFTSNHLATFGGSPSYNHAFATAIQEALKLLPDAKTTKSSSKRFDA